MYGGEGEGGDGRMRSGKCEDEKRDLGRVDSGVGRRDEEGEGSDGERKKGEREDSDVGRRGGERECKDVERRGGEGEDSGGERRDGRWEGIGGGCRDSLQCWSMSACPHLLQTRPAGPVDRDHMHEQLDELHKRSHDQSEIT